MTRKRKKGKRMAAILFAVVAVLVVAAVVALFVVKNSKKNRVSAQDTLKNYFQLVEDKKYEDMYSYLSDSAKKEFSKEEFVERNQKIYDGIGCTKIQIKVSEEESEISGNKARLVYTTTMQTLGGESTFENTADLTRDKEKQFKLEWNSNLIFPKLSEKCKVRVDTAPAKRGSILDRNGNVLAEDGEVSEVGLVPGKLPENKEETIAKIASILDMTAEDINNELSASWVQDDSYVPLKKMAKDDTEKETALLQCKGVLIQTVEGRVYPYGEAAGHLTGYVQSINEDQLKELEGQGYSSGSLIGKAGLEKVYEEQLRAKDGYSIYIEDEEGTLVGTIASKDGEDGKNITVSIDVSLQQNLYNAFRDDCGADVAMDPKTGEVLALVSTPGYDPNEFIWGISDARWKELNDENGKQPLTNRFLASWVPGSTFKPVVAMIGITKGKLDPNENFGYEGLSWQKDESWGGYHVTTLTDYGSEANMKNALIFSDNIYFAKAALKIGAEDLIDGFRSIGFSEKVPFELALTESTFGTDDKIDNEIQLADTGYGQGQVLANPVHLASIYTALSNNGNMIKPTLLLTDGTGEVYKENVFSQEAVSQVKDALVQVLENPRGTGHAAYLDGHKLFGKTGTAETKQSKDEEGATEFGWLACQTDESEEKQLEIISMVQDIQGKEHGYINAKIREIFAAYLQ